MSIVSYAQNFEDVLLWRALRHVERGTYVDVGAQDPIIDSVSKGFYEKGWRGVHIEPTAHYAERLRHDRPDEVVIQAAVSDQPGMLKLYEIPNTGMSTASAEIAATHRQGGWDVVEILVPAVTLDQVLSGIDAPEIHWLKVDVEGFEREVLEGWRESPYRPWIVVVEATYPAAQIETHGAWDDLLLAKNYKCVYFDGLNRFYLSAPHDDLLVHFRYGPCLWDEFQIPETSRQARSLREHHNQDLDQTRAEAVAQIVQQADIASAAQANASQLNEALAEARSTLHQTQGELRYTQGALDHTQRVLDQTQGELRYTQGALDHTQRVLDQTQGELRYTHGALDHTQRVLDQTQGELRYTHGALDHTQRVLDQTQGELHDTQGALDRVTAEIRSRADKWSRQRAHLAAELEAVTGSRWWRISVPFRKMPSLLAVLAAEFTTDREFSVDGVGSPVAASLDELLSTTGQTFVQRAFVTLLGREADPEGFRHFLGRLMLGVPPDIIVAEIATSPEGCQFGARLSGLDELVRRYRLLRRPVIGRLLRLLGVSARGRRAFWFLPSSPITGAGTGHIASSVEELLSLRDEAFVRCVYATVLGRDPDPDGFGHHLARIRDGESRRAILVAICLSPEGRRRETTLPGLGRIVRCYRWRTAPMVGPILRLIGACDERGNVQRQLAAIESQLDLLGRLVPSSETAEHAQKQVDVAQLSVAPPAEVGKPVTATPCSHSITSSETEAWSSPITWRAEPASDELRQHSLIRIEITRALADLGHKITTNLQGIMADVTAVVTSPPLHVETGDSPALLIGHDWDESCYPRDWIDEFNASLGGVTCASTHGTKMLLDHGLNIPVAAIGLGVDHWERILPKPVYQAPGKTFRFLHVSSCSIGTGIDLLLKSFGRAFENADDVSLIIKASGGLPGEMMALLDRLRAADTRFPDVMLIEDNLTDAEVKALYLQCHAFVAPSRVEGFGLPVAQALLSGLPAVVTAWGGHLDYCDETNCWLVDYRFQRAKTARHLLASVWAEPTENSLDEALLAAYRATPAERFAKSWSGRKRLMQQFTWKDVAVRLAAEVKYSKAQLLPEPTKHRVGWVSTWNVKCGIAGHVGHLLATIPTDDFVVFAGRQEPRIRDDDTNCLRSWDVGKDANGLDEILRLLPEWSVSALVIQFNYGFFNHLELNDFIASARAKGIVVIVDFHSTIDPRGEEQNFRLADFLAALRKCDRLLAHNPADMNRLKTLGLVDNVMFFPLGALTWNGRLTGSLKQSVPPLIASFGYCLPGKGLVELVEAVELLKRTDRPVRLRMLNAQYPGIESELMVERIKEVIEQLGLQDEVEMCTDFLEDEVCLTRLSEADLMVNPYQRTSESASASVRYGLTAGCPVAVTPLPIFDDLGDAVFRVPGTTPSELAEGIDAALALLRSASETARRVQQAASRWLDEHDCSRQGIRLMRMARALTQREAAIHTVAGEVP